MSTGAKIVMTRGLCAATLVVALGACNPPEQKPHHPEPMVPRPPATAESETQAEQAQQPTAATSPAQSSRPSVQPDVQEPSRSGAEPATQPAFQTEADDTETAEVEIIDIPEDGRQTMPQQPHGDSDDQAATAGGARPAAASTGGRLAQGAESSQDDAGRSGSHEAGDSIGAAGGPQTEAEKRAALDQRFSGELAEFDERMRRARRAAEAEKAARSAAAGGGGFDAGDEFGGGGAGGRRQPPPAGAGAGGAARQSTGLGHTPDLSGSEQEGSERYARTTTAELDIPDGRNDDIVARQLREAATRETDPVLQEKLWDEYRKYKKGLSGR
jgi:hypothetical protein